MSTDSENDVLFERDRALGKIILNRPRRLNALTHDMIRRMAEQLAAWADDDAVRIVAILSSDPRAFCAGGDIRAVVDLIPDSLDDALTFFRDEYALNLAFKRFPKPLVAFMDGFVMGGGAGVSVHARYRVAGDTLGFAMPETAIGFIPDCGASHFLSRCPRGLGMWLGMTGAIIGPAEAMAANIVDYISPSARRDAVLDALAAADGSDAAEEVALEVLALNATAPPPPEFRTHLDALEAAFEQPSVVQIVAALEAGDAALQASAAAIRANAPFAVVATHAMLSRAERDADLADALATEFRIVRACIQREDYAAGVRAKVIDKTGAPPAWSPARIEDVSPAEVAALFEDDGQPGLWSR